MDKQLRRDIFKYQAKMYIYSQENISGDLMINPQIKSKLTLMFITRLISLTKE